MSETDTLHRIQLAVSSLGHRVFRNQTGTYHLADGRWLSSGLCVGSSDLIGWTRDGRFLAIEVKTTRERMTGAQSNFLQAVSRAGGVTLVARSEQDALAALSGR